MRQVTGKGARVPGPNPNASYKLRYTPPAGSEERETSFAITGAHLEKTWKAYRLRVEGDQPVWNPDFVSVNGALVFFRSDFSVEGVLVCLSAAVLVCHRWCVYFRR